MKPTKLDVKLVDYGFVIFNFDKFSDGNRKGFVDLPPQTYLICILHCCG